MRGANRATMSPPTDLIVLMGPAGAGKSALGEALAQRTNWPFQEGDDYHPPENKQKQAQGISLVDADRAKWIDAMVVAANANPAPRLLLACSALTPYVQSRLIAETRRHVRWFLLHLSRDELQRRVQERQGHFMPASLIDDQLAALHPPKGAVYLSAASIDVLCDQVLAELV